MAPKKKVQAKMSLGDFLHEDKFGGSWADEVEETYEIGSQPLPPPTVERRTPYGSSSMMDRGYQPREYPTELPTKPPYTAHLGNLSYEATEEGINEFFAHCEITSVRIIEDRIEQRPKGFAYAEFATIEGLKKALLKDGDSFEGRVMRVKIAEPPKAGYSASGETARDLSSWERKGPLADSGPTRGGDRPSFGERRPPRDMPADDGKVRDFGNWERRGPLSPVAPPEGSSSRDSSRPGMGEGRGESFRKDRRTSPATWGEGRQEGSRPPREFKERAERPERPERAPTAADMDNQWRNNMKPEPVPSREASEAPTSPRPAAAPVGRPRLNLAKRTVSENVDSAPASASGDSKASPFGAARPIDTAAKERELAEKRERDIQEKKEAEEKAKEEKRLAKEAAAKEAAEKAKAEEEEKEKAKAAEESQPKVEAPETKETDEPQASEAQNNSTGEQKAPARPKEAPQNPPKPKASDTGNWRSASGEQRSARGGYQNASRGRGDARGRGAPRAPRNLDRPARANGAPAPAQQPASPSAPAPAPAPAEAEAAPPQDPDGWTTVPSKGRRK